MLQSPLRQAVRRAQRLPLRETCMTCQCTCGRTFTPQLPLVQKRSAIRAPAVRYKQNFKDGTMQFAQRLASFDEDRLVQWFSASYVGPKKERVQLYASFVKEFAAKLAQSEMRDTLYERGRGPRGSSAVVDAETFHRMQHSRGFSDRSLASITIGLRLAEDDDYHRLGTSILYSAANADNLWAILVVMGSVYEQHKWIQGLFEMPNNAKVRKRLENIAWESSDSRAAVMAGKIAYDTGDKTKAVAFWKHGMKGAVAASERARRARIEGRSLSDDNLLDTGLADLSAPWVELQTHYINHKDFDNAKWAISIGCQQDDPNSYFAASLFEKDTDSVQSGWFHHITKAATSGHVRSMHELGLWYAQDGWPYLSDEPPDGIKPTPFDRYPPSSSKQPGDGPSTWERLLVSLGFVARRAQSASAQAFHSAAYPTTPEGRFGMALEWLNVAMGFHYAPSYLAAAELHLQKDLYSAAATPKEALDLSTARYSYKSEDDYRVTKRIRQPEREEEAIVVNPYYNPEKARSLVREIFYAAAGLQTRLHEIRRKVQPLSGMKINTANRPAYFEEMGEDMGWNLKKWFRFPEVRELFMNERTGRLIDKERGDIDLLEEAKALCDEQEWDMYAEDGSLLYRHGMRSRAASASKR